MTDYEQCNNCGNLYIVGFETHYCSRCGHKVREAKEYYEEKYSNDR